MSAARAWAVSPSAMPASLSAARTAVLHRPCWSDRPYGSHRTYRAAGAHGGNRPHRSAWPAGWGDRCHRAYGTDRPHGTHGNSGASWNEWGYGADRSNWSDRDKWYERRYGTHWADRSTGATGPTGATGAHGADGCQWE